MCIVIDLYVIHQEYQPAIIFMRFSTRKHKYAERHTHFSHTLRPYMQSDTFFSVNRGCKRLHHHQNGYWVVCVDKYTWLLCIFGIADIAQVPIVLQFIYFVDWWNGMVWNDMGISWHTQRLFLTPNQKKKKQSIAAHFGDPNWRSIWPRQSN